MPVPALITDLSATPSSNSPAGTETPSSTDDYLRTLSAFVKQNYDKGVTNAAAAAASQAAADAANAAAVHLTGAETIGGIKTFTDPPVLPVATILPAGSEWYGKSVGEVFFLRDDLAGVSAPPTGNANYRYIKLTAADAYNTGVLTSESVTGSAPLVIATAIISLAGSPINGLTVNLLNTERRFIRAGSSGTPENDELKAHGHSLRLRSQISTTGHGILALPSGSDAADASQASGTSSVAVEQSGGTETRPRNMGATAYMRIK